MTFFGTNRSAMSGPKSQDVAGKTSFLHMETNVEENVNQDIDTSSFVDSLSNLTQSSSALGIRLLALEEYSNYAQNAMEILKTKTHLLSDSNENTMKTRDELLSRNKTNTISLESLYNVQFEFYNYKCDVKDDYIRTEEALKIKKAHYEKIITSYKMKWDAVKLEYEKLPMASELSMLEKDNIFFDAEAKKLENLVAKTKADYLAKYNECWSNLLAKILEFATEYQTHTKFAMAADEVGRKNMELQELLQKLQSREEPKIIRQYSEYFKPIPLVTNIPTKGRGADTSKFSFDLTSFDEISIPQDNLEMETEDESLFNLYENGRNMEITQNRNSVLSNENVDSKKIQPPVENVDPAAVGDKCCNENHDYNEVTEHDIRPSGNYSKDETEVYDEDMYHPDSDPDVRNVNDKRFQSNNQRLASDVGDKAQMYSESSKSESDVKPAPKKEGKSFKLKERKKEIRKHAQSEDKENDKSAPKKGKYSFNTKTAQDSPKICSAEGVPPSDHITFNFDFNKENFTNEENQGNEDDKFSFFMKSDCSFSESGSIFKLF